MKKLNLDVANLGATEILSRDELKKVLGGSDWDLFGSDYWGSDNPLGSNSTNLYFCECNDYSDSWWKNYNSSDHYQQDINIRCRNIGGYCTLQ